MHKTLMKTHNAQNPHENPTMHKIPPWIAPAPVHEHNKGVRGPERAPPCDGATSWGAAIQQNHVRYSPSPCTLLNGLQPLDPLMGEWGLHEHEPHMHIAALQG